jgi:hypothetical protein
MKDILAPATVAQEQNLKAKLKKKHGDVRDAVLIFTEQPSGNTSPKVRVFHFGAGSAADVHWMVSTAKNRLEPT